MPGRALGVRPYPLAQYRNGITALLLAGLALLAYVFGSGEAQNATRTLPAAGGVFTEGVTGTPLYVNPILCDYNEIDRTLCRLLFRGLMRFNPRGEPVPDLAVSYDLSEDGLVYTFELQPDARWHDGARVTSQDVQFTYELLQHPDFPGERARAEAARLASVRAVDALTIEFALEQPFAPFLDLTTLGLLPQHIYGSVPVADLFAAAQRLPIVGNGAWRVTRRDSAALHLGPHRFHTARPPFISVLEFRFFPSAAELYAAFVRGEIEGLSAGLAQNLEVLPNKASVQVHASAESSLILILLNHRSETAPALGEVQVRKALLHAVNREQVLASSQLGWGAVAHSPVPANNWAHKANLPIYPYDPWQAALLLEDSGWRDRDGDGLVDRDGAPFRVTLLTSRNALLAAYADAIASYWRDVGLQAETAFLPFGLMIQERLAAGAFDAALIHISDLEGDPDPFRFWHSSQEPTGLNYGAWFNPYADQLMAKARGTLDQQARRVLYHRFQDIFGAELPALPISYPIYAYGVHERVRNVQLGPLNHASERFATFADWYIVTVAVPAPANQDAFPP